jgi:hypothetical protein
VYIWLEYNILDMDFKKGDSVVCILAKKHTRLTVGNIYPVLSVGDGRIKVMCDHGIAGMMDIKYFKLSRSSKIANLLDHYKNENRKPSNPLITEW